MKRCPKCNEQNPDEANFCHACRAPIPKTGEKTRCVNGHIMDPSWQICPICKAGEASAQTQAPDQQPSAQNYSQPAQGEKARRKTVIEEGANAPSEPEGAIKRPKRVTQIANLPEFGNGLETERKKKIVGFLLTYSMEESGRYYEIREGRHIVGSADIADIRVPEDGQMSSEHAILLYRRGKFLFKDNLSTNGSFVNGEECFGDVELKNYDRVLMGKTEFRLLMAEPPEDKE